MTTTHDDKAREQRRAMFRAYCECFNNGSRMTPDAIADRLLDAARAALSPASTGQEAVAWFTEDHLTDKSATTWNAEIAERWRAKGWPVGSLFAAPAQQVEAEIRDKALEEAAKLCARQKLFKTADDIRALKSESESGRPVSGM